MITLMEWFDSDVKRWRSGAAIVWSLLLMIPFAFTFSAISTFSPHDLITWLEGSLYSLTDWAFWTNMLGISVVVFIITCLNIRHCRVFYHVPCNRLQSIWCHMSPVRVLSMISHMTCSGFITWFLTRLIGGSFRSLVQPNIENTDVNVLNEYHVFVILHGIFVGGVYDVVFFLNGHHVIQFPVIEQTKFFQVKGQLFSLLQASAWRSFKNMKYFYIIYYLFCASSVRSWSSVGDVARHKSSNGAVGLDSISGLLSLSLAFFTWLCGMFVDFLLSLPFLLYTVYHTQPFEFPIDSVSELFHDKCLHQALACNEHPLLQYLACLDLSQLAKHSKQRRQTIFSVTPLGGHPLNWINISSVCLFQLKDFVAQIVDHNDCPSGQRVVRQPTDLNKQGTAANAFPGTTQRDLTYRATGMLSSPLTYGNTSLQEQKPKYQTVVAKITAKLLDVVKTHPLVTYFMGDRPELLSLKLFCKSQKYIWLISGISHLASSSYAEDTYGVVQQTLPEILTTLLNLLEALNRQMKQFPVRKQNEVDRTNIQSLKMALKETVKEAIYRIVITFDRHLSSIPLSADHSRRLSLFREFKE